MFKIIAIIIFLHFSFSIFAQQKKWLIYSEAGLGNYLQLKDDYKYLYSFGFSFEKLNPKKKNNLWLQVTFQHSFKNTTKSVYIDNPFPFYIYRTTFSSYNFDVSIGKKYTLSKRMHLGIAPSIAYFTGGKLKDFGFAAEEPNYLSTVDKYRFKRLAVGLNVNPQFKISTKSHLALQYKLQVSVGDLNKDDLSSIITSYPTRLHNISLVFGYRIN